ncbi:MAG: STAS domain-containing protein [Chloroflexi bacterium]|nr:STAS domain-containing protein [Chloroflexota bacterium]
MLSKDLKVDIRKVTGPAPFSDMHIIDLQGDVNSAGDAAIKAAYNSATGEGARHILFNFEKVEYINTSGIAVLIGIVMDAQKAQQKILFFHVNRHYQKIFDLVRLPMYAKIYDSEAEAVAAARAEP